MGVCIYIYIFLFGATFARGSKCETTAYRRCACIDIPTDIRFSIYRCTMYTYILYGCVYIHIYISCRSDFCARLEAWNNCIPKVRMYRYTHRYAFSYIQVYIYIRMHVHVYHIWVCVYTYKYFFSKRLLRAARSVKQLHTEGVYI